jgi:hypothetical protein
VSDCIPAAAHEAYCILACYVSRALHLCCHIRFCCICIRSCMPSRPGCWFGTIFDFISTIPAVIYLFLNRLYFRFTHLFMWIFFFSGCSVGSYVHKTVNYQTMGEPSKARLGHPLQHYRRRNWIVIEGALARCNVTVLWGNGHFTRT